MRRPAGTGPERLARLVRCSRGALAALVLGTSVALASMGVGAEAPRFVPWNRPETPPLGLKDLDRRERSLADYRGKVVLLNFWATWCEPCRDEMPSIQRLRDQLGAHPFEAVAINYGESSARVRDYLTKERLDLTVLLDPDRHVARAWRVRVLPSSFLVAADGRVRFTVVGEIDWARDDAVSVVRGMLPGRGAGPGYDDACRARSTVSNRCFSSDGMVVSRSFLAASMVPR